MAASWRSLTCEANSTRPPLGRISRPLDPRHSPARFAPKPRRGPPWRACFNRSRKRTRVSLSSRAHREFSAYRTRSRCMERRRNRVRRRVPPHRTFLPIPAWADFAFAQRNGGRPPGRPPIHWLRIRGLTKPAPRRFVRSPVLDLRRPSPVVSCGSPTLPLVR